jgi:hypothetical protein
MGSRIDWIEALTKALLPRTPRVWIRRRRNRQIFERYLRPTDVFLVGHPKSGNTWLAYMLAILLAKDSASAVTLANIKDHVPPVHGKDHRIRDFSQLLSPRIFREEYPVHADLYPKTIYILRDPRAVLVSLYHMYRIECDDPDMPITTFMNDYLTKQGCFQRWNRGLIRWDRQVQTWTERAADDRRVLIVRYEDMVQDRRRVLERVATFAGISYDAKLMRLVYERSSFEAMQKEEEHHGAEAYPGDMAKRGRFIRQGTVDGWKDEIPTDLIRRLEHEFAGVMHVTGYLPDRTSL